MLSIRQIPPPSSHLLLLLLLLLVPTPPTPLCHRQSLTDAAAILLHPFSVDSPLEKSSGALRLLLTAADVGDTANLAGPDSPGVVNAAGQFPNYDSAEEGEEEEVEAEHGDNKVDGTTQTGWGIPWPDNGIEDAINGWVSSQEPEDEMATVGVSRTADGLRGDKQNWKRHLIAAPTFDNCPPGTRLMRNECREVFVEGSRR